MDTSFFMDDQAARARALRRPAPPAEEELQAPVRMDETPVAPPEPDPTRMLHYNRKTRDYTQHLPTADVRIPYQDAQAMRLRQGYTLHGGGTNVWRPPERPEPLPSMGVPMDETSPLEAARLPHLRALSAAETALQAGASGHPEMWTEAHMEQLANLRRARQEMEALGTDDAQMAASRNLLRNGQLVAMPTSTRVGSR